MGICNKLAWPIPPLFLAFLIGKEVSDITVSDLFTPFYVIIAAFIILGIISLMAPLPEVKAAGEDDSEGGAGHVRMQPAKPLYGNFRTFCWDVLPSSST